MMENRADLEQAASRADPEIPVNPRKDESTTRNWLTVAGAFLVYFVSFGFMNSFGYFQTFYQHDYLAEYSPSVIAVIGSLQLGLMYIVGPIVGVLFDAYGLQVCSSRPFFAIRY